MPVKYLNGKLQGYKILYRAISRGRQRILRPVTLIKMAIGENSSEVIEGLEPYTVYCVQIGAVTNKGVGRLSSERCAGKYNINTLDIHPFHVSRVFLPGHQHFERSLGVAVNHDGLST